MIFLREKIPWSSSHPNQLWTCNLWGPRPERENKSTKHAKVNTTAVDKNDLVLDQCGNVTLSMRKVVRRRTASFSTTGPSSFRPITSNCLRGGTERIRKLNQNLWPTNYMSNDATNNNNWKVEETFKEDIRSLLLQLGDVELGHGESLFRVHDVLPLKIWCRLL